MEVTETRSEGLARELKVVVPAATLEERLSAYLDDLRTKVRLKGFRPGKVPVAHLRRMYGDDTMDAVLGSVDGSVRFHGLTPTNTRLDGLEKHQRLIESYKKLHAARAARAGINLAG